MSNKYGVCYTNNHFTTENGMHCREYMNYAVFTECHREKYRIGYRPVPLYRGRPNVRQWWASTPVSGGRHLPCKSKAWKLSAASGGLK